MRIQSIVVGYLGTNCYILGDEATGTCAVIDPGASAGAILDKIREMGLKAETILLTHGHYDHIMAVPELVRQTGARVCIHKKDQWLLDCDEVLRYGTRAVSRRAPRVTVHSAQIWPPSSQARLRQPSPVRVSCRSWGSSGRREMSISWTALSRSWPKSA